MGNNDGTSTVTIILTQAELRALSRLANADMLSMSDVAHHLVRIGLKRLGYLICEPVSSDASGVQQHAEQLQ